VSSAASFVLLAWVCWSTRGHYESRGIAGLALIWLFQLWPKRFDKIPDWFLWAAALVFCYLLHRDVRLLFVLPTWERGLRGLALLGGLALLARGRFGLAAWGVALGCLIDVSLLVPLASPKPAIDVFVASQEAIRFFLRGDLVYSGGYSEIYGGRYGYEPGFNYWPVVLYFLTPFQAIIGDPRWGLVLAHLFSVALLYRYADRAVAVLWLALPIGPFVLEQAWNEPLLILLTFAFCFLWRAKKETEAAVVLGLVLAGKQYLLPFGVLSLLWIFRAQGNRSALRCAGIAAAVFLFSLVYFLVREPQGFFHTTVTKVLAFPYREDSLNFTTYLVRHGWEWGSLLRRVLIVAAFFYSGFRIFKKPSAESWAGANAFFYFAAFTLGNHAFCNYYYWVLGLWALQLALRQKDLQAPSVYSVSPA